MSAKIALKQETKGDYPEVLKLLYWLLANRMKLDWWRL